MRVWSMATVVCVITVAVITGIVVLSLANKPTGDLLAVFAAGVLPVVTGYISSMHAKVDNVEKQVNGRLSRIIEILAHTPPVEEKHDDE